MMCAERDEIRAVTGTELTESPSTGRGEPSVTGTEASSAALTGWTLTRFASYYEAQLSSREPVLGAAHFAEVFA